MSTLSRIIIPSAFLLALALYPPPAYSGAASTGAVSSAPAPTTPPAKVPTAAAAPPGTTTTTLVETRLAAPQAISRSYSLTVGSSSATAPVLVIPAKEMALETYDRIVEDLSVMGRIIEKSLRTPYGSLATTNLYQRSDLYGQTFFLPSSGAGPEIVRSASGRPKAIYVGGYGVLFSLRVNFPLMPPPEAPKPGPAAGQTDQVWEAAQRELANPETTVRPGRTRPAAEPYKAEAVEELKNKLTAILKHAANIRDLEPQSWLLVLVQGPAALPEQSQESADNQAPDLTARATGGTLLTLRAMKADIDQFAKGQLDETQFRQRVQIVTR